jgi:hypothetical protein
MYQACGNMEVPSDQTVVWRYMTHTKFVVFLQQRRLWFTRLGKLEDKHEGALTRVRMASSRLMPNVPLHHWSRQLGGNYLDIVKRDFRLMGRDRTFVDCWHMNDGESAAMWGLYLKTGEGVAVKTTFGKLTASLRDPDRAICAGVIRYLDYNTQTTEPDNPFAPFISKRKSFEHERELRLLTQEALHPELWDSGSKRWKDDTDIRAGVEVPVDMDLLIEEVRVAPTMPPWYFDSVVELAERYGVRARVLKSSQDDAPVL